MAAPVLQKSWTISANNRIAIASYATLVLQGGKYLKTIADTLLANGHTCKGSSNGTAGAMDGVNRWTSDAAASVQGATTTTPVSWMVLTDGNAANILLSFVGATGDIARIAFSPGGLYVAAGTPTHTPTATDESVLFTGTSLIGSSLTDDRIVNVWVDSQAKLMRTCVYAAGALLTGTWGVELVNANRVTLAYSPAIWGFAFTSANLQATAAGLFSAFTANARGGYARINGTVANCFLGTESFNGGAYSQFIQTVKTELQKGIGQAMFACAIGSTTSTRQGPIGDLYDWWIGGLGTAVGGVGAALVVFPGGQWMTLPSAAASNGQAVWPWDGTTVPETA